ncbi:MAG: gfo/Idh/MocA family oxidoreductase, partial [Candidatus Scatosoma sp.]
DLQEHLKKAQAGFAVPKYTTETIPQNGENPQHVGIINNFANAVLGVEPLYVDGKEGLHCVELIDAMLLSAWKNETVSLPVNDEEYYGYLQKKIATSKRKTGEDRLIDNSTSFGGTK